MSESDIEIAVIKSQLEEIKATLAEVKVAVTDLVSIKADVATQAAVQRSHDEKILQLQKAQEVLKGQMQDEMSYTSKLQGGFKFAAVVVGVLQVIVVAVCGWVGTTLINTQSDIASMKQTVHHLEIDVQR